MEKLKKVASSIETQQSLTAFNIKRKMLGRGHFRECISSKIINGLPVIEPPAQHLYVLLSYCTLSYINDASLKLFLKAEQT